MAVYLRLVFRPPALLFHQTRSLTVLTEPWQRCNWNTLRRDSLLTSSSLKTNFHVPTRTYLKPYFADASATLWVQETLITIHNHLGCPWWATIVISVVLLRLMTTFPLSVYQNYNMARYENLKPEIIALGAEIKRETDAAKKMYNLNETMAKRIFKQSLKTQIQKLIIRDNCHPFKGVISVFFQIPVWFLVSISLRNLSSGYPNRPDMVVTFYELSTEGIAWLQNLTLPDPFIILPVLLTVLNLSIIEIQLLRQANLVPNSKMKRWITNGMRGFCCLLTPVAVFMPASMTLYWFTSSLFGLAQNIVIISPSIRRALRIPLTPSENPHPYTTLKNNFVNKFLRSSSV